MSWAMISTEPTIVVRTRFGAALSRASLVRRVPEGSSHDEYSRFLICYIFFGALLFERAANSLVPPMTLKEVAAKSDWIFVARVEDMSSATAMHDAYGELNVVRLGVVDVLRGFPVAKGMRENCLELLHRKELIGVAPLEEGQTFLFFWKNGEYGPSLAPGEYGALHISDQLMVDTSLFAGMRERTLLDDVKKLLAVDPDAAVERVEKPDAGCLASKLQPS